MTTLRSITKVLVPVLLVLLVVAAIAWRWLLHTEAGARWIIAQAQSATDQQLQVHTLSGDLGSGLSLRGVSFAADAFNIEVAATQLAVNVDILPLAIRVRALDVQDVDVQLLAADAETAPDDADASLESLSLPLLVELADSTISDIAITGVQAEQPYTIQGIELAGSWHEQISLDATISQVPIPTNVIEPLDLEVSANGDLQQFDLAVKALNDDLWMNSRLRDLAQNLGWEIDAGLSDVALQIPERDAPLELTDLQASSNGSIDGPAAWSVDLTSPDVAVTGEGEVSLGDVWSVDAALQLARLNLNTLLADWPAEQPASGELKLSLGPDQLVIDDSRIVIAATDTTLNIDALVDLANGVTQGDLRWSNFSWPGSTGVRSETGSVTLSGSPDDWRVAGNIAVATDLLPAGQFQIEGGGNTDQMQINILDSQVLDGSLAGQANVSWRDDKAWSASLQMTGLELAALDERWPSDVSGSINAEGTEAPYVRDIVLTDVSGELLTFGIVANGQVILTENNFVAQDMLLRHGDSRIAIDGDPRSSDGIAFDVSLDDIGRYVPNANGVLEVVGSLSIATEQPFIEIEGDGTDIGIGDLQAASLEIREGDSGDCPINTELLIPELFVGGDAFTDVVVALCGDDASQEVSFAASYDEVDVALSAAGTGDKFPVPERWEGELQQFVIELAGEPPAMLTNPVAMSFGSDSAELQRACLRSESGMELCSAVDWVADDSVNLSAQMNDVPLRLINRWLPVDLRFDQSISGQLQWRNVAGSGMDGQAQITMTAGSIVSNSNPDISIPTDPGALNFMIVNGESLSGDASIPMPGFGQVTGNLDIPDLSRGIDSAIDGEIDIEFSDMTIVAALVPAIYDAHGFFRADLDFTGRLSEPRLVGEFSVVDGSLDFIPLGLQLDKINLESKLFDDGQMELSGDFFAGEGRAEIFTRSDYARTGAKGFELELRGKNLTLVDVPDINALTDIDLRVNYDYSRITIDGDILIPKARVTATKLAVTQDTESTDVVIVAGELPAADEGTAEATEINISGSVGIELGDDISMDLGLATANIKGKTTFIWDDSLIPIADGRYDLTGSVQAFGQALEITEGGLRFPKIPADNPFVRVRAEREIYGNPQVKTAGVLVDGRLRQIAVEAYTRPLTTEERALTLLLTGSDFDFEQGVGAIDFGTYIAPRVFVSYGVGLFETENVIRVRYDLNRGFGVTATSGEKESGVDLSYRLER